MMDMCCSRASWITIFWISVLVPMSMPRVGSSRISRSGLRHQPAGDDGLLLVAAGEVADQLLRRGDLDLQQLDVLVGDPLLLLLRGMWFHMPFLA